MDMEGLVRMKQWMMFKGGNAVSKLVSSTPLIPNHTILGYQRSYSTLKRSRSGCFLVTVSTFHTGHGGPTPLTTKKTNASKCIEHYQILWWFNPPPWWIVLCARLKLLCYPSLPRHPYKWDGSQASFATTLARAGRRTLRVRNLCWCLGVGEM